MYCSNLYYSKVVGKNFIQNKYYYLNEFLKNNFISNEVKDKFVVFFQKMQRSYFSFSKLAQIYKFKKIPVSVNTDMCMNEIDPNNKNVITIIQNDSKYLFLTSDLLRIINSSLLNSCHFFPEPLQPKNPFNNLPFNKSTLYNIYFFIKYNTIHSAILFSLFFKSNFNIDNFLYDNETLIRDTFIKNYAKNTPASVLYHDFKNMININMRYTKKLLINPEIPNEKLIDIFRPYLHLYYEFRYGVNGTDKRNNSIIELKSRLKDFVKFNPTFGRKIYKFEKKYVMIKCEKTNNMVYVLKRVKSFSFNLHHIDFYKKHEQDSFLSNYDNNILNARFYSPSYESLDNAYESEQSDYDSEEEDSEIFEENENEDEDEPFPNIIEENEGNH
jgi:hypothetical protein